RVGGAGVVSAGDGLRAVSLSAGGAGFLGRFPGLARRRPTRAAARAGRRQARDLGTGAPGCDPGDGSRRDRRIGHPAVTAARYVFGKVALFDLRNGVAAKRRTLATAPVLSRRRVVHFYENVVQLVWFGELPRLSVVAFIELENLLLGRFRFDRQGLIGVFRKLDLLDLLDLRRDQVGLDHFFLAWCGHRGDACQRLLRQLIFHSEDDGADFQVIAWSHYLPTHDPPAIEISAVDTVEILGADVAILKGNEAVAAADLASHDADAAIAPPADHGLSVTKLDGAATRSIGLHDQSNVHSHPGTDQPLRQEEEALFPIGFPILLSIADQRTTASASP